MVLAAAAAERLPTGAAARLMEAAGDAFTQGLNTVATLGAVVIVGLAVAAAALLRRKKLQRQRWARCLMASQQTQCGDRARTNTRDRRQLKRDPNGIVVNLLTHVP
jgi:hypothetical protein